MTPGMLLLFLFIGWIFFAFLVAKAAYFVSDRRWIAATAAALVLWLPFWDVIPGWILYRQAVHEWSGVRISKTVQAEGYLNRQMTICLDCWRLLNVEDNYKYLEVYLSGTSIPNALLAEPGYYQFSFEAAGNPLCTSLDGVPGRSHIEKTIPPGRCLVVQRRDRPFSRYEYSTGHHFLDGLGSFRPVQVSWFKVTDLMDGKVIAEAYQVHFASWLGRIIGFPKWHYTNLDEGTYIEIDVRQVIKPKA